MSTHWKLLPTKPKIAGACMFYKNNVNTLKILAISEVLFKPHWWIFGLITPTLTIISMSEASSSKA